MYPYTSERRNVLGCTTEKFPEGPVQLNSSLLLYIAQCAAGAHWGALLSICLYFLYLALPEETTHQSSHPSLIDDCDEKEVSSVLTHILQNLNNNEVLFYLFKHQTKKLTFKFATIG